MKNELTKLANMLFDADIPFEYIGEKFNRNYDFGQDRYGDVGSYTRNQILYGVTYSNKGDKTWKFDVICQYGSYGAKEGMLESYGELGCDEDGEPRVITAEEAFEIIKNDYTKGN